MELGRLKPNPDNPRTITDAKLAQLKAAIDEFGDLGGFVFNRKSKQLVGGHQRAKVFGKDAKVVIEKKYAKPTRTGTVAEGYVELGGERFKYREVAWDDVKEKAANIAANKGAGEWDMPKLAEWLRDIDAIGFDLSLTMFDTAELKGILSAAGSGDGEGGAEYTKKIEAPIYEIKGEKPPVKSLTDGEKARELLKEINAAKISDEEKTFLRTAALRHVVFDYEKIAEYYAHAPAKTQRLMEKSALVIIDFEKALENGFMAISEEIAEAYKNGE